jgi:hypothetical protein
MNIQEDALDAIREDVIARGERFYMEHLKDRLVREHRGRFAAIDPDTGCYFLGDTSAEAVGAAYDSMSGTRFYLKRIGYTAAHYIGSSPAGRIELTAVLFRHRGRQQLLFRHVESR